MERICDLAMQQNKQSSQFLSNPYARLFLLLFDLNIDFSEQSEGFREKCLHFFIDNIHSSVKENSEYSHNHCILCVDNLFTLLSINKENTFDINKIPKDILTMPNSEGTPLFHAYIGKTNRNLLSMNIEIFTPEMLQLKDSSGKTTMEKILFNKW